MIKSGILFVLMIVLGYGPVLGQEVSEKSKSHSQSSEGNQKTEIEKQADQDLPCPLGRNLTKEVKYGSYTLRTYRYPNIERCLRVSKDGKLVFSLRGWQFHIGKNFFKDSGVAIGTDLTGAGMPDAVVSEWTGGAHCCFIVRVFELAEQFKEIAKINAEHSDGARFVDLHHDGAYEFVGNDWAFAYWRVSFMQSPAPRIVLKYQDGRFRLAYDLMKKPEPSQEHFAEIVRDTQSAEEWTDEAPPNCDMDCGVPVALWKNMLDLIYTGHPDLAWKLIDQSWPPARKDKSAFVRDFCQQLSQSE